MINLRTLILFVVFGLAGCAHEQPNSPSSDIPGYETIPWELAETLISECQVAELWQSHSLDVGLTLKNGSKVHAVEPYIDNVLYKVREHPECGDFPIEIE